MHLFHECRKTSILWIQLQGFFNTGLDISSILPQGTIFGLPDDNLEQKYVLNGTLLIFKNYLYKTREKKNSFSTYVETMLQKLEILKLIQKTKKNMARNEQLSTFQ